MAKLFTSRNLLIAGGVGAAVYYIPRSRVNPIGNIFETPASKAIGDRHSSGGGSNTHTPGVATTRGNSAAIVSPQTNPTGVDSNHFQENVAAQKPGGSAGQSAFPGSESFHKAQYGPNNEKGK